MLHIVNPPGRQPAAAEPNAVRVERVERVLRIAREHEHLRQIWPARRAGPHLNPPPFRESESAERMQAKAAAGTQRIAHRERNSVASARRFGYTVVALGIALLFGVAYWGQS